MSFYNDRILPHLINLTMRNREFVPYRERVLCHAQGRVLEIGIGSGLNLPHYGSRVEEIIGLEPAPRLIEMAKRAARGCKAPVTFMSGSAQSIPIDDHSIDTVVSTWTLCSIPDAHGALCEMRRVLKAGGQLLFVEHGLAPDDEIQRWQNRLTPLWKRIGGGCHLNRPIGGLIESAGFNMNKLQTGYGKGARPMAFFYEGCATPGWNPAPTRRM